MKNSGKKRSIQLICEKCGKEFPNKSKLNRHLLLISGVKNFKCEICPRKFALEWNLKVHQQIHGGAEIHECRIVGCQKTFLQKSNRNVHEKSHIRDKNSNVENILKLHANQRTRTKKSSCGKENSNSGRNELLVVLGNGEEEADTDIFFANSEDNEKKIDKDIKSQPSDEYNEKKMDEDLNSQSSYEYNDLGY